MGTAFQTEKTAHAKASGHVWQEPRTPAEASIGENRWAMYHDVTRAAWWEGALRTPPCRKWGEPTLVQ